MTDFDKHVIQLSADIAAIQLAIGARVLPTIKRLLVALEMAERWHRSRQGMKRAVFVAAVLFAMLVITR